VRGSPELGAVLRQVRASQSLSQTQVAARVCCDPSLVSMVESGKRVLQADLARRLDHLYGTGTMIVNLAGSLAYPGRPGCATLEGDGDVVLVELPLRGVMVPVSRRALLAALGIGATTGALSDVRNAMAGVPADEELLADLTESLRGLGEAGRALPPAKVVDPLTAQVAVLDAVRLRAPRHLRRDYLMLSAQYAETLSWMVQESSDLQGAVYWVDRAGQWADQAGWPAMKAYAHVRRSALASTCAGDGRAAVVHASRALSLPDAPVRVKAEAAKQKAYGYALSGFTNTCRQALDLSLRLLQESATIGEEADPIIGLRSTDVPSCAAQYQATCDLYLGGGENAISLLDSCRADVGPDSRRQAIVGSRLARAYAQAGDPDRACAEAIQALDSGQALDSLNTRTELRRALAPLSRWPDREDVAEVRHRITALA
jgi:transcriptional regulator with XRE-family HTH domain